MLQTSDSKTGCVNNVKEFMKMVGHSEDEDEEREERIQNEIIVDSYDPEEQALGWHAYLSGKLQFPFSARCVVSREISPLEPGEEVEVVGMASDEECMHKMFVLIRWKRRQLAVPLMQLEGIQVDEETQQAIEDWRYWVNQGYEL
jgi:hypothetical protein